MERFKIAHVDPLGQGVSKVGEKVTFIRKTLPGESGTCEIHKQAKSVQFATVVKIEGPSSERIESECPHFSECPGCHYLHTDYESEIRYKEQSLRKYFQGVLDENTPVKIISSNKRFHYRNRMQLHYNKKMNSLGFIDSLTNKTVEVPSCKLFDERLRDKWSSLYEKNFPKSAPTKGHVEISLNSDAIWNERYAHDGFSQVNSEMNEQLCTLVKEHFDKHRSLKEDEFVLDLFGGAGNLSASINHQTVVVDSFASGTNNSTQTFIKHNIFKESVEKFLKKTPSLNFPVILIDPPRSGFKNINDWLEKFRPELVIFVSCFAAKQARDLQSVATKYSLKELVLMDMFPGTHHYETIAVLQNNS